MKFSGRLQVEADSRNWLKADLVLERGRLELTSGDDVLGTWATSQVTAERVEGDRFSLQLGEEAAMFIADDALGFSYEALPQLNKRHLIPVGGMMEKIKSGFRADDVRPQPAGEEPAPPSAGPAPTSAASLTGKRLRELIKEAAVSPAPPPPVGESEPKRSLGLEGVFRRRQAPTESPEPTPVPEAFPPQDEELLERLFDPSMDTPGANPPLAQDDGPASIWADLVATSPSVEDEPSALFEEEGDFDLGEPEPIDWSANPLGETRAQTRESLAPAWPGWSEPVEEAAEIPTQPSYAALDVNHSEPAVPTPEPSPLAPAVSPPSPAGELSPDLAGAVKRVAQAVAAGSLTESQLNAITDLVKAVAAASQPGTSPSH